VPALQEAVQQIFSEDESSGANDSGPSSQLAGSYMEDSSEVKDYLAGLEWGGGGRPAGPWGKERLIRSFSSQTRVS